LLITLQQYAEYFSESLNNFFIKLIIEKTSLGVIRMREEENAGITADIEYLEKAFKKFTPEIISSPYIPTPSVMVKGPQIPIKNISKGKKKDKAPTTKPRITFSKKRFENIIDCLHKGAQAYSVGDYGTAINQFTRLLDKEWLKHATYFYLIKTIIKLDIEKEILSLRTRPSSTNIKMKKSKK
jgi:hypothetical protein